MLASEGMNAKRCLFWILFHCFVYDLKGWITISPFWSIRYHDVKTVPIFWMGYRQVWGIGHSALYTASPPHHLNPSEQQRYCSLTSLPSQWLKLTNNPFQFLTLPHCEELGNWNNQDKSAVTLVKEWRSHLECSSPSRHNMEKNLVTWLTMKKPQLCGSSSWIPVPFSHSSHPNWSPSLHGRETSCTLCLCLNCWHTKSWA